MPRNQPARPKVFISHAGVDHAFVYRLAADLERDGCDVWLDDVKMHIGDSIPAQVKKAIGEAHYVIVVLSKASVRRKWVKEELNHAIGETVAKGKRFILPCVIEECMLPPFLKDRAHADFANRPYHEVYASLLKAILPEGELHMEVQAALLQLHSTRPEARRLAAEMLGKLGDRAAVPALAKALRDEDSQVRREAAEALRKLGGAAAIIPKLFEHLVSGDDELRGWAKTTLKALGVNPWPKMKRRL